MKKLNITWVDSKLTKDCCLLDGVPFVADITEETIGEILKKSLEVVDPLENGKMYSAQQIADAINKSEFSDRIKAEIAIVVGMTIAEKSKETGKMILDDYHYKECNSISGYCREMTESLLDKGFDEAMVVTSSVIGMGALLVLRAKEEGFWVDDSSDNIERLLNEAKEIINPKVN